MSLVAANAVGLGDGSSKETTSPSPSALFTGRRIQRSSERQKTRNLGNEIQKNRSDGGMFVSFRLLVALRPLPFLPLLFVPIARESPL